MTVTRTTTNLPSSWKAGSTPPCQAETYRALSAGQAAQQAGSLTTWQASTQTTMTSGQRKQAMSEFGEIWPDPGDDWYPGDDDYEEKIEQARVDEELAFPPDRFYDDYTSESETAEILADPDAMAAIREEEIDYEENEDAYFDVEDYDEMQHDDGITTDDFDHWPGGREFSS